MNPASHEQPSPAPDSDLEKIVVAKGWATAEQVQKALAHQMDELAKGRKLRLGEALVEQGALTAEQVRQALVLQGKTPMRCPTCGKVFNVRGYRPGTRALCKICKVALVPPSSSTDLHVDDTTEGHRHVQLGEAVAPSMVDLVPGYAIERRLGAGGMGEVYLARQKSLDRLVALKLLPADLGKDPGYVQRFLSEARSAAKLKHENIVAAVDSGEANGRSYFVMEFVDGETLQQILDREKRLPEKRALGISRQIARGLKHAHQQGIIHRDIKPANIMIGFDGAAKICDFGLARDVHKDVTLTQAGYVHSSPAYASPEQCKGKRDLDHRSDMYSLGVTLFEMLTGRRPFEDPVPSALFVKHVTETPPAATAFNPAVSAGANQLVLRLLRKHPEARFKDYDELLETIDSLEQGRVLRAPDSTPKLLIRRHRPWKPWMAVAGGGGLVLILLLAWLMLPGKKPPSPQAQAQPTALGPIDAQARRDLQAARDFQEHAKRDSARFAEIKSRWRSLEERYRGTPNHPFFAGAMVEFDALVEKQALNAAQEILNEATRLRTAGRSSEALLQLQSYPEGYAGTEGHRDVEALRKEIRLEIEFKYGKGKESLLSKLASEQFDDARRELAALRERVRIERNGQVQYVDRRYGEELEALARSIEEEALFARQRELQAKANQAKPAPAPAPAVEKPAQPPPPPPSPPVNEVKPKPPPPKKAPMPPAASLNEAEALIREVFKEEYAKRSETEQLRLSRKLLQVASETKDDPAGRFVLLRESARLAAQFGDLPMGFEAVRELASLYEIDAPAMKTELLAAAADAARSDEQFSALARMMLALAEEADRSGQVESAHKHASTALAHAKRARDVPLASAADARVKEYAAAKSLAEQVKKARAALASNPSDGEAALQVGLYQAAILGDWQEALPILAKSAEPAVRDAADRDLAGATDGPASATTGDSWWEVAQSCPEWARAGVTARAAEWYERALAGLDGDARLKVEERLQQIPADVDRDGWLRIRSARSFGMAGSLRSPMVLTAPPNERNLVKLEPFPSGQFDGVFVRVQLPPQGAVQALVAFEPRAFAVFVQRQNSTVLAVADTRGAPRTIMSKPVPASNDWTFEVLLDGREYVILANGEELHRLATTRSTIAGLWLQAGWNKVEFSDIKLRRKR